MSLIRSNLFRRHLSQNLVRSRVRAQFCGGREHRRSCSGDAVANGVAEVAAERQFGRDGGNHAVAGANCTERLDLRRAAEDAFSGRYAGTEGGAHRHDQPVGGAFCNQFRAVIGQFGGSGKISTRNLGGIGAGLSRIVSSITDDERTVLSVSQATEDVEGVSDVALSLPRIIGRDGVVATLMPELDTSERAALKRSAEVISGFSSKLRF